MEPYLCYLCMGVWVDATSIEDCMHTFCRSCIFEHLSSSLTDPACPQCDTIISKPNAFNALHPDPQKQSIAWSYKPLNFCDEAARRRSFWESDPQLRAQYPVESERDLALTEQARINLYRQQIKFIKIIDELDCHFLLRHTVVEESIVGFAQYLDHIPFDRLYLRVNKAATIGHFIVLIQQRMRSVTQDWEEQPYVQILTGSRRSAIQENVQLEHALTMIPVVTCPEGYRTLWYSVFLRIKDQQQQQKEAVNITQLTENEQKSNGQIKRKIAQDDDNCNDDESCDDKNKDDDNCDDDTWSPAKRFCRRSPSRTRKSYRNTKNRLRSNTALNKNKKSFPRKNPLRKTKSSSQTLKTTCQTPESSSPVPETPPPVSELASLISISSSPESTPMMASRSFDSPTPHLAAFFVAQTTSSTPSPSGTTSPGPAPVRSPSPSTSPSTASEKLNRWKSRPVRQNSSVRQIDSQVTGRRSFLSVPSRAQPRKEMEGNEKKTEEEKRGANGLQEKEVSKETLPLQEIQHKQAPNETQQKRESDSEENGSELSRDEVSLQQADRLEEPKNKTNRRGRRRDARRDSDKADEVTRRTQKQLEDQQKSIQMLKNKRRKRDNERHHHQQVEVEQGKQQLPQKPRELESAQKSGENQLLQKKQDVDIQLQKQSPQRPQELESIQEAVEHQQLQKKPEDNEEHERQLQKHFPKSQDQTESVQQTVENQPLQKKQKKDKLNEKQLPKHSPESQEQAESVQVAENQQLQKEQENNKQHEKQLPKHSPKSQEQAESVQVAENKQLQKEQENNKQHEKQLPKHSPKSQEQAESVQVAENQQLQKEQENNKQYEKQLPKHSPKSQEQAESVQVAENKLLQKEQENNKQHQKQLQNQSQQKQPHDESSQQDVENKHLKKKRENNKQQKEQLQKQSPEKQQELESIQQAVEHQIENVESKKKQEGKKQKHLPQKQAQAHNGLSTEQEVECELNEDNKQRQSGVQHMAVPVKPIQIRYVPKKTRIPIAPSNGHPVLFVPKKAVVVKSSVKEIRTIAQLKASDVWLGTQEEQLRRDVYRQNRVKEVIRCWIPYRLMRDPLAARYRPSREENVAQIELYRPRRKGETHAQMAAAAVTRLKELNRAADAQYFAAKGWSPQPKPSNDRQHQQRVTVIRTTTRENPMVSNGHMIGDPSRKMPVNSQAASSNSLRARADNLQTRAVNSQAMTSTSPEGVYTLGLAVPPPPAAFNSAAKSKRRYTRRKKLSISQISFTSAPASTPELQGGEVQQGEQLLHDAQQHPQAQTQNRNRDDVMMISSDEDSERVEGRNLCSPVFNQPGCSRASSSSSSSSSVIRPRSMEQDFSEASVFMSVLGQHKKKLKRGKGRGR